MNFWLMKSEPDEYSITDLSRDGQSAWTGVRNYQARNFLCAMRPGERAFFYHSSCATPGIVGLMEITSAAAFADPTQFDAASPYFDARSPREAPRWLSVQVRFLAQTPPLSLPQLRAEPSLSDLTILRRGNRLSVTPVSKDHAARLCAMMGFEE